MRQTIALGLFMIAGFTLAVQAQGKAAASTDSYLPPIAQEIVTDDMGRVIAVPEKKEVRCPRQTKRTAVILAFGQSNSANFAVQPYKSEHGSHVLNLFEGKCYVASSPLLGANGTWGESWTLLGNLLVQDRVFDTVIIVAAGIGATSVTRWEKGGKLNPMLMETVAQTKKAKYEFTHLLWHQGEADTRNSAEAYTRSFLSMLGTLRDSGVTAPIFVCVANANRVESKDWDPNVPVRLAQQGLPDPMKGIYAGVDTDVLILKADGYRGHFNKGGQEKFANVWLGILKEYQSKQRKPANY